MKIPASAATGAATAELIVKRSRFLSQVEFFDNPDAIKETIARVRQLHAGCSHVVYAYIVGSAGDVFGLSDDGEPKGTAGRPVLEVLKGFGLTDTLLTVVRYFGGTKLGTGGLVRAYSESARAALSLLETEELVDRVTFFVDMPYAMYEGSRRLIESHAGSVEEAAFGQSVALTGFIPADARNNLVAGLADLSGGKVIPVFMDCEG